MSLHHLGLPGRALAGIACVLVAFIASAQEPLTIHSVSAKVVTPGTLIEIRTDAVKVDSIEWVAGSKPPRFLPLSTTGAVFGVPHDASSGWYKVVVVAGERRSKPIDIRVTGKEVKVAPRIDDITLASVQFVGGRVRAVIMVHAANPDVGALLHLDGQPVATQLSRVLFVGRPKPETYKYPISHFGTLWAVIERPLGSAVSVIVENENNLRSGERSLVLPSSRETLDSDGDGIPDRIEVDGVDWDGDGVKEVDLAAMGASPLRKDLFVEVDWMEGAKSQATTRTWQIVEQAFERLPILNSDGSVGVRVWIDRGQDDVFARGGTVLADRNCLGMGDEDTVNVIGLQVIKANPANFHPARAGIFHYGVIGHRSFDTETGVGCTSRTVSIGSPASGYADVHGDDFYISCPTCGERSIASVVFHELGHNLGLQHGGNDAVHRKPTYPSTMNYRYQFDGVDTDCDLKGEGFDSFSWGMIQDLDEKKLHERVGLCGAKPYDWNKNGNESEVISADTNDDGERTELNDHADIGALRFDLRPSPRINLGER